MSKSADAATRFTSAGPWASTKPGAATRATKLSFADPPPPNETPQQKVARLREASRRARLAQITTFDKMYFWGRVMADGAHRWTAYFLITSAGVLGVLAVFSIGDMVVYNRRKRREFFADQDRQQAEVLRAARLAVTQGTATPSQITLVEAIREEEEGWKQWQDNRSWWQRIWWKAHGDYHTEEPLKKAKRELMEDAALSTQKMDGSSDLGIVKAVKEAASKADTVETKLKASAAGGPLDRAAEEVTAAAASTAKSWTSWITGR